MADLNALIAQGAQFNLPNPVDQYSKVMQLQAAQQQMQVQRQQMQQIQEDRAGFAKLREKLADQNLTPEQYEAALTQSPDPSHQKMGVELRMRRTRLDELDTALQKARGAGAAPALAAVGAPSAMPAPIEAPSEIAPFSTSAQLILGKPYAEMSYGERIAFDTSKIKHPQFGKPGTVYTPEDKMVYTLEGQEVPFSNYVNANILNSAGAGERAAMAAMPNALAARVAPAAPVANAMTAKQAQLAQIRNELDVLTSPRYSDLDGVKDRVNVLREEQKRLSESPVGKVDIDKFEPESVAKFFETGNFADLKRVTAIDGGRYLPLGAGKVFDKDTKQIISADRVPPAAAAAKILKIGNVPYTLDAEGTLVPVPIQGGLPIVAKGGAGKAAAGGAGKQNIRMLNGVPHVLDMATQTWTPMDVASGIAPVTGVTPGGAGKRGAVGVSDVGVAPAVGGKVPEAYRTKAFELQNVADSVNKFANAADAYQPGDLLNPVKRGKISGAHQTAMLQAKELFNLGVLNGGDERILLNVLANPVDFSAAIIPIETIRQQAKELSNVIESANSNLAKVYGQKVIPLNPRVTPSGASDLRNAADKILGGK